MLCYIQLCDAIFEAVITRNDVKRQTLRHLILLSNTSFSKFDILEMYSKPTAVGEKADETDNIDALSWSRVTLLMLDLIGAGNIIWMYIQFGSCGKFVSEGL